MSASPYHHGNLREALVEAAVAAAREHGPEGLAVRELARRVGVSHNAAYRHFADRDALVAAVAERGMAALVQTGEAHLARVRDADPVRRAARRLVELGRGYVGFALAEPGLFRVVFQAYPQAQEHARTAPPSEPADGGDPLGQLSGCLDDLVAVGVLHADARPGAEITCWSVVHGFAVLHLDGPLRSVPAAQRDASLDQTLQAVLRSYAATTGRLDPSPLPAAVNDR